MKKPTVWFAKGYSNLYHAIHDVRNAAGGNAYNLLCSHSNPEFVGAAAADKFIVEPRVRGQAYIDFVCDTIRENNVTVMFPSQLQPLLDEHRAEIEGAGATLVTVATADMIRRIDNKAALYTYLRDKGVPGIPECRTASTREEFEAGYAALAGRHSRVCFKPVQGVYGEGFRILKRTPSVIQDIISESPSIGVSSVLATMGKQRFPTLMLMQYLGGAERSVDCLAYHGKLIGGVIRKKSTIPGAAQLIEHNPKLMAQVKHLVELLNLNGMFNVQFKDSGGQHYLLEINTRLSGRSFNATMVGFNQPYLAAELFSGRKKPEELEFSITTGVRIGNVSAGVLLSAEQPQRLREDRESA